MPDDEHAPADNELSSGSSPLPGESPVKGRRDSRVKKEAPVPLQPVGQQHASTDVKGR